MDGALTLARKRKTSFFVSLSDDSDHQNPINESPANIAPNTEKSGTIDPKFVEMAGLGAWMVALSAFVLMNNFVGPWPASIGQVSERIWFAMHMVGGMLFAGGIILTTAIEWLVAATRDEKILDFWFRKVPMLDLSIVIPGLSFAMMSGVGLAVERYGSLGAAPTHIKAVFHTLVAFALWWGLTDLTTQHKAHEAVLEWSKNNDTDAPVPQIVELRKISNIVSCFFCFVLYGVMVFKPGYL